MVTVPPVPRRDSLEGVVLRLSCGRTVSTGDETGLRVPPVEVPVSTGLCFSRESVRILNDRTRLWETTSTLLR